MIVQAWNPLEDFDERCVFLLRLTFYNKLTITVVLNVVLKKGTAELYDPFLVM